MITLLSLIPNPIIVHSEEQVNARQIKGKFKTPLVELKRITLVRSNRGDPKY